MSHGFGGGGFSRGRVKFLLEFLVGRRESYQYLFPPGLAGFALARPFFRLGFLPYFQVIEGGEGANRSVVDLRLTKMEKECVLLNSEEGSPWKLG